MSTPTNPGSIVVHLHELALHLEENGFLQVEGIASIETLLTLTDEEVYALYLFFRHTPGVAALVRRAFLEGQHQRHCWFEGTKDTTNQ